MKTDRIAMISIAVEPGAHAAEDELAQLDVEERHQAPERREAVVPWS